MKEEKCLRFAGDLLEEVDEISRIIPEGDIAEIVNSHTVTCSTFLTIYCC